MRELREHTYTRTYYTHSHTHTHIYTHTPNTPLLPLELNLLARIHKDAHKLQCSAPLSPSFTLLLLRHCLRVSLACKFITRRANWGQLVTFYDINTKYLCPVVIYVSQEKKKGKQRRRGRGAKKYHKDYSEALCVFIVSLAIISALKRCQTVRFLLPAVRSFVRSCA